MNTLSRTALAGTIAILTLTACQANAKSATTGKASEQLTRATQCEQFGDRQFRQQKAVSGTTVQSTYDEKTGFCTVVAQNKTPGNTYSSRIRTNMFDPSSTSVSFETNVQPLPVQGRETPIPQRLICTSVQKTKDGKLVCDPYKPSPDDMFSPFTMFNDAF